MDVVGELLRASLLTALGDDADRLTHVRAAIKTTADALVGDKRPGVPSAVLAALDENAAADSSIVGDITERLLAEWPTFPNAFPTAPTEVLRAITLAGVGDAASRNTQVMQAAWYTARTALEELSPGRWAEPVTAVIAQWRGPVDTAIRNTWVPASASASLRMPALKTISNDATIAVKSPLRQRTKEIVASGNWQTFSQELMATFPDVVNGLLGASEFLAAEAQRRALAQVKEFASELGTRLRETLSVQEQAVAAIELRSTLLWWKESQYSERLGRPYSDLAGADLAIAAAHELHLLVPEITPISVEHVLADLVAGVDGGSVRVDDLAAADEASALPVVSTVSTPATLLDAVRTGGTTPLLGKGEVSLARAAVLLFRDLQAARLAVAPPLAPPDDKPPS